MSKDYGLIIPSKNKAALKSSVFKKPSIFEEDAESDEEAAKPTGLPCNLKRQDRVVQEKAVEEDPTVFQYDEVYDDMDRKRKESKLSRKDLDKKPKYIIRLLDAAERRKRENERRIERQVQREREAEGEEFKDKESFVTSAYKKKLEELKLLDEQEKREEYLESIGDVRKQGNLDGFYRHLYDQKVNVEDVKEEKTEDDDKNKEEDVASCRKSDDEKSNIDDVEDHTEGKKNSKVVSGNKRHYRKRDASKSEDSGGEETKNLSHLPSNLDADSDFSIDSGSDSEGEPKPKKVKEAKVVPEMIDEAKNGAIEAATDAPTVPDGDIKPVEKPKEEKPKKPKIDIWKKRTVGVVFEEALQRYYQRKTLRESG